MDPVTDYALRVTQGDLRDKCCEWEIKSCRRHLADLEKSKDPSYPYCFDPTRAERIYKFFGCISRLDKPDETIELKDWQQFDDGCIFGWVEKTTGKRRFKRSYKRIARGHAKTTNAAGVSLYIMTADALYPPGHPELATFEMEPCVQICAVDRTQGKVMLNDIRRIGSTSEAVSKRLIIKETYIKNKRRGGSVEVLSKDTKNKSGARPTVIMLEEWHEHQTSTVRDRATSGLGKKAQCLEYIITTAGVDAENKPCYKDDLYFKKILAGEVEQDDVFVMIRELDEQDDPHDESAWCKANPFFRDLTDDYAQTLFKQVKSEHDNAYNMGDPDKIREFLIMRMNRWQADSEQKYMSGCMDRLKSCRVSPEKFRELTFGLHGHYGYDLGKCIDLSGVAWCTFLQDGRLAFSVHGYLPEDRAIQHEHSDRVPYRAWAKDGWVTLTPGAVTDNRQVEEWIYRQDATCWKATEIDYDGHNATDMALRMRDHFGNDEMVIEIPQTCAGLNQATKRFREMVLQGKVVYDGSPLAEWCLGNAVEVINNFGDIKLSKRNKDDSQRIDPIAALMNALARLIVLQDAKQNDINEIFKRRGYSIAG